MARSIAITMAAVATIAAGSACNSPALARGSHGGHGGHVGGGGPVAHMSTHGNWVGSPVHGSWVAGGHHHHHDHHHHFRRFFVGGYGYFEPYYYYDYNCYERVWTTRGWRWVSVCY